MTESMAHRAPCPLCADTGTSLHLRIEDVNFTREISAFDVLRCHECGLAFMSPWPTQNDIEEIYVHNRTFSTAFVNPNRDRFLFDHLEKLYWRYGSDIRSMARTCVALSEGKKHPRILGVGCSSGLFLDALSPLAPDAELTGIDIDPGAPRSTSPQLCERIIVGDFLNCDLKPGFDIIAFRFVLEHVLSPADFLAKAAELLKPGGILFLSVPDMESPQAQAEGESWREFPHPDRRIGHIMWFTKKTINHIADTYGFDVQRRLNRGEIFYHLPVFLQKILRAVFGVDDTQNRFIQNYQTRILFSVVFDGILAEKISVGDKIYAFLKKKPRV